MLHWAIIFLIVAIIAAVLGYSGIASTAAGMAKIVFYISISLFVISLAYSLVKNFLL